MRKFLQIIIVFSIVTVAGSALYVYLTDKHVIVYNDGTILTVDDSDVIFLNDGTILYDNSIIEQGEIKYYSKRKITHILLDMRNRSDSKWNRIESALNNFLSGNNISTNFKITIPLAILALLLFILDRLKSIGYGTK